jgi:glucans biosynthesis protein
MVSFDSFEAFPPAERRFSRAAGIALLTALVFCMPSSAAAAPAAKDAEPATAVQDPFPSIIQKAQRRAMRSYKPAEAQAPDFLLSLTEAQWRSICFKPEQSLWRDRNLLFDVELFHPGFIYNRQVDIHVIDGGASSLPFSPDMFVYGNKALADKVKQTPLAFAGFRIVYPLHNPSSRDNIASFLGASYFRGAGKHSDEGAHARGLAVNTALPEGEEFPFFREFWIVTPKPGDTSLTLYALLDAPNLTGAYRYVITPGTSTVMDVETRIFLRKDAAWPQKVGIAPLTSMFLYSETDNGRPNDYRPEVHTSDGLLFSAGEKSWSWAPLANPSRLAINTFPMENPRGFGLLQRDAAFDHYQDIANRFDRKASVWVEPRGDWGPGRVELIQIPSAEEIHDNMTAFWVPDSLVPPGDTKAPQVLSLAYTLYWMTPGVTPHALGRASATRLVRHGETIRFFIDFESEALKSLPEDFGLTSLVEAPEHVPITEKQLVKNPATGGWRLSFTVRLPRQDSVMQSIISAREGSARLRFRALLKKGENLPDPLTEEWIYDLPL